MKWNLGLICADIDIIKMVSNYKAPPTLEDSTVYENWKKEIKIWQVFRDLPKMKQGPAIYLTLSGKAREAVFELDIEKLNDDSGVDTVLKRLDKMFLQDSNQSAYMAYDKFEKFQMLPDMDIKEYINQFESLYNKIRVHNMELPDGVLAYRVLKCANISQEHEQLAQVTITEFSYSDMTEHLKEIFGDVAEKQNSVTDVVKVEPTFHDERRGILWKLWQKSNERSLEQ